MSELVIIIADDHPLFRGALKQAVSGLDGQQTIMEAGDFEAARSAATACNDADLMLLDLAMPGVVSATDDATTVRRSIELGASGFISKSSGIDDIRDGIRAVLEGDVWIPASCQGEKEHDPDVADLIGRLRTLTPQQSRVLGMLAEGLLNKQIAYALNVSEATIKAHVSAILLKLKVDSRTQAVIQLSKMNTSAMVA